MKLKRVFPLLAAALWLSFFSISCEETEDSDVFPELPPVEALQMDFTDFVETQNLGANLKSSQSYQYVLYSYVTVSVWNVLVSAPMVVPVAAYAEALKQTPVYLGDNSWEWSFSGLAEGEAFSARLVASRISNEEYTAQMFVSKEGDYEDFKWYEGTIRYDRTHADWTLYESPDNAVPWLNIEWNKDWEQETSDITYTIVTPGGDQNGSFITYGVTNDTDYNAFYTVSLSEKETFIKWNRTTKEGGVMDETQFGDADWHFWNELLQDLGMD